MASQIVHLSYAVPGAKVGVRAAIGAESRKGSSPSVTALGGVDFRARSGILRKASQCQTTLVGSASSSSSSVFGGSLWGSVVSNGSAGSGSGGALGSTCAYGFYGLHGVSTEAIRWGLAAACAVLLMKRDAGAKKQFYAAILALEAPRDVVYWAKSEYGLWVAFIGLAIKLFYSNSLPGELDYPLAVYLFIASLPGAAMVRRGTLGAVVISTLLACFVVYQYFSNMDKISTGFKGERLITTFAILFTAIACIGFLGMVL